MKKYFVFAILLILFIGSCKSDSNKSATDTTKAEKSSVEKAPFIKLGEFDVKAGEYVDKEVVVQGIVDHVCKHGGKKILLVNDDGDVHVESDERFPDNITGSELKVTGVVSEFRIDEAYCLHKEEDNIQEHKEGKRDEEYYKSVQEDIKYYRDSMKTAGSDHLSYYSLDYVSHIEVK